MSTSLQRVTQRGGARSEVQADLASSVVDIWLRLQLAPSAYLYVHRKVAGAVSCNGWLSPTAQANRRIAESCSLTMVEGLFKGARCLRASQLLIKWTCSVVLITRTNIYIGHLCRAPVPEPILSHKDTRQLRVWALNC